MIKNVKIYISVCTLNQEYIFSNIYIGIILIYKNTLKNITLKKKILFK